MEKIDLKEYSYVLAIYECGSISKAAEKLFISQPSLSVYIKSLEDRLGITFFNKTDKGYSLTFEGEKYIEYAKKILALNSNLQKELTDIQDKKIGRIKLGVMLSRGTTLIPMILSNAKKEYPQIEIDIIEETQSNLEKMLNNNEIDLALINHPFKVHDLSYKYIGSNQVVLVVPNNNPVIAYAESIPNSPYKRLDLKYCDKEDFILLKSGRSLRRYADSLFTQSGINPKILFETSLAITAYKSACSNLGLTFIYSSQYESEKNNNVSAFSVGFPITTADYVIAYEKEKTLTEVEKTIIDFIEKKLNGATW